MGQSIFTNLNPGVACASLKVGSKVCVSSRVGCTRYAVIGPSDTCYAQWSAHGLSMSAFMSLNPGVDCAKLPVSSRVCVSSAAACTGFATVQPGASCWSLWTDHGLSREDFLSLNSDIVCSALAVGSRVCVSSSAACTQHVSVQGGDTCFGLRTRHGISESAFLMLNLGVDCSRLAAGSRICVSATPPPTVPCGARVTVRSGDTCYALWSQYGLSESEFLALNPRVDCSNLAVGEQLCVAPGRAPTPSPPTRPATTTATTTTTTTSTTTSSSACAKLVRVRAGDTCSAILATYRISQSMLRKWNDGISCSALEVGSQVCVWKDPACGSTGCLRGCTASVPVQPGDTCFGLWTKHRIARSTFSTLNLGLDCSALTVGSEVCLAGPSGPLSCAPSGRLHTVASGESCLSIWKASGLTWSQFAGANPGLDCGVLVVGQQLCLGPDGGASCRDRDMRGGASCACPGDNATVRANETCDSLAFRLRVPPQRLSELNPVLTGRCASLAAGAPACTSAGTASLTAVECLLWHPVSSGDTCWEAWTAAGLSEEQFRAINPGVDCASLREGQLLCTADARLAPPKAKAWCSHREELSSTATCSELARARGITEADLMQLNAGLGCTGPLAPGTWLCTAGSVVPPSQDSSPLNPQLVHATGVAAGVLADVDPELEGLVRQLAEAPSKALRDRIGSQLRRLLSRSNSRELAQRIEDALGRSQTEQVAVPFGSLRDFCAQLLADPSAASRPGVDCLCGTGVAAREPLLYCAALLYESISEGAGAPTGGRRTEASTSAPEGAAGAAVVRAGWGARRAAAAGGLPGDAVGAVSDGFFSVVEKAQHGWLATLLGCSTGTFDPKKQQEQLKNALGSTKTRRTSNQTKNAIKTLVEGAMKSEFECEKKACMPLAGVFDLCVSAGVKVPNVAMSRAREGARNALLGVCGGGSCFIADSNWAKSAVLETLTGFTASLALKLCILGEYADKFWWPMKDVLKSLCVTIFSAAWGVATGQVTLQAGIELKILGFGISATVSGNIQAYRSDMVCRDSLMRCKEFCLRSLGSVVVQIKFELDLGWLFGTHAWTVDFPSDRGVPECPPESQAIFGGLKKTLESVDAGKVLVSEQPDHSWAPSTIYKWPDLLAALDIMSVKGVDDKKFWLGDTAEDATYGLVSLAAFLAQSMTETIRYDACDENNWDLDTHYAATNACGQHGQSYQDYKCPAGQERYQCEVDPNMEVRGVSHAKWWGAPPAFFCAPRSKMPAAPEWDYLQPQCHAGAPRDTAMPLDDYLRYVQTFGEDKCRDYEHQKAGQWRLCGGAGCPNSPAPAFQRSARTDLEGCCWWGRGVIQTTGICNFGKLSYFLGARAKREGRQAMFPDIDFCRDPEAICSSTSHPELKWVAGLYFYMNEVQPWDDGTWNYRDQLRKFVDGGMHESDTRFIDGVSGIVNRGCPSITDCEAGPAHNVDSRRGNFRTVLSAMGLGSQR